MDFEEQIIRIISERTDVPINQITSTTVIDSITSDPLQYVEIVIDFRNEFRISIDDNDFDSNSTVAYALNLITRTYYKEHPYVIYPLPSNAIGRDIMNFIAEGLGQADLLSIVPSQNIADFANNDLDLIQIELSNKISEIANVSVEQVVDCTTIEELYHLALNKYFEDNDEDEIYYKPKEDLTPYPYTFQWPKWSLYHDPNFLTFFGYYPAVNTITPSQKKIAEGILFLLEQIDRERFRPLDGNLQTATTPYQLAVVGCMELVCIFLNKIGLTQTLVPMTPFELKDATVNTTLFTSVAVPQPGDIFLWNLEQDNGHAGVVRSYNQYTGMVTILDEYCYGTTYNYRQMTVHHLSVFLESNDGWTGYFRPNI